MIHQNSKTKRLKDLFSVEVDDNPFAIGKWIEGDSLAPPCQAELDVVESILTLANLNDESIICDLGCGDGRICIFASYLYGCKSVGCEIEANLIEQFKSKVQLLNLEDKVTIMHCDLTELDLSYTTILTLYLLPEAIELIKPKLIEFLKRENTSK